MATSKESSSSSKSSTPRRHVETMLTSECIDKHCKYATEVLRDGKSFKIRCEYKEKEYYFGQCIAMCEYFERSNPEEVKKLRAQEKKIESNEDNE